ncbi:MAG: flagellar hook-basal body protein [Candidatus Marinimicrobia bacterium]|nr:flagellar hook-basal body protein [Candidatus Neomarinimicrobiota bacterium]
MDFDLSRVARNMTRNMFGTDIVANNLANISTTGFKRDSSFTDWFIEAVNVGGAQRYTDYSQGELRKTDNPYDLALASQGFFLVNTSSGPAFTRNGHFTVNDEGFILTGQGYRLMGDQGPVSILNATGTPGKLRITRDGEIFVDEILLDRLTIVNIPNLSSLEKIGANMFRVADNDLVTQLEPEQIEVRQGMLEGSNVQPIVEMVALIEMQRNFESTQRVARAMDHIMGRATQLGDYR